VLQDYLKRTDARIDMRDQAFLKFVSEHNDKMTKLIVESTDAIKQSTKAIRASSELICIASKALEKTSNKIFNGAK